MAVAETGQETIQAIVRSYNARHGIVLQPVQVQELMYTMRSLIDENRYLQERLELLEGEATEVDGQTVLDTYVSAGEGSDETEVEDSGESIDRLIESGD